MSVWETMGGVATGSGASTGSSLLGGMGGFDPTGMALTLGANALSSGPAGPSRADSNPKNYGNVYNVSPSILNLGELIKNMNAGGPRNGGGLGMEIQPLNTSNLSSNNISASISPIVIIGGALAVGLVMALVK